jgi:hypothetical protein
MYPVGLLVQIRDRTSHKTRLVHSERLQPTSFAFHDVPPRRDLELATSR